MVLKIQFSTVLQTLQTQATTAAFRRGGQGLACALDTTNDNKIRNCTRFLATAGVYLSNGVFIPQKILNPTNKKKRGSPQSEPAIQDASENEFFHFF